MANVEACKRLDRLFHRFEGRLLDEIISGVPLADIIKDQLPSLSDIEWLATMKLPPQTLVTRNEGPPVELTENEQRACAALRRGFALGMRFAHEEAKKAEK
jgi:hypothetical protein